MKEAVKDVDEQPVVDSIATTLEIEANTDDGYGTQITIGARVVRSDPRQLCTREWYAFSPRHQSHACQKQETWTPRLGALFCTRAQQNPGDTTTR